MSKDVVIEIIRIVPTLIWAGALIGVVLIFRTTIRDQLLPRMSGVKVFGVEATFVMAALDEAAQSAKAGPTALGSSDNRRQVARRAERLAPVIHGASVLVVNDVPPEITSFTRLLELIGISVQLVTSTPAALQALRTRSFRFDAIISDVRRDDVPDEGINFLNQLRKEEANHPPVIFGVRDLRPELGTPAYAFGITNRFDELLNLLLDALERRG